MWDLESYFGYMVMVLLNFQVWMYKYFGVSPKIWEEVVGIFPRFLCWLPEHRLSTPSRCSWEIWHLVIDNLTTDGVSSSFSFFWNLWHLVMARSFLILSSFYDFSDELKSLGWMLGVC